MKADERVARKLSNASETSKISEQEMADERASFDLALMLQNEESKELIGDDAGMYNMKIPFQ